MPVIIHSTKRKTAGHARTSTLPPVILTPDLEEGVSSAAVIMYFITCVCIFAMLALMITFGVYNKRKKDTRRHHLYRHGEKDPKSVPSRGSLTTDRSMDGKEPNSKSKDAGGRHRQQKQPKIWTNAAVQGGATAPQELKLLFEPKFDLSLPPLEPTTKSDYSNKAAGANAYLLKKLAIMHGTKIKTKKDSKKVPHSARVFANLTATIGNSMKNFETPKETEA